jgi:hypothetical protein
MSAVIIVSKDDGFTAVLAEQLTRELSLQCSVAADMKAAESWLVQANLIICDGQQELIKQDIPVLELAFSHAPYRMNEVLAQVRSALVGASEAIDMGSGYSFLPRARQISNEAGGAVELTDREMELLAALLQSGTDGLSKDALLKQVWGFEADINTHTLETHVYRLRSKVREAFGTDMIAAVEGGYKLDI